MWYPVNGLQIHDDPHPDGNNVPVPASTDPAPAADKLVDWIQTEKDLTVDETVSLGFSPFSMEESGDHRTIILDAMRYVEAGIIRWGVGIRCALHSWSEKGSVKGSVALVAAQATLNLAYTRTTINVLGYNSPKLAAALPGFEEMGVSNYANLMKALDTGRDEILGADPALLTPRPIALWLPAPPPSEDRRPWHFHQHRG